MTERQQEGVQSRRTMGPNPLLPLVIYAVALYQFIEYWNSGLLVLLALSIVTAGIGTYVAFDWWGWLDAE